MPALPATPAAERYDGGASAFGVPLGLLSQVLRERAEQWRRPSVLGTAGFLASCALVGGVARAPVPAGMHLPSAFGGLLQPSHGTGTASAVVVVLALGVLVLCWWQLLRAVLAGRFGGRTVVTLALAWAAPMLLGPPLLSLDAYAYLAQGDMVARGLDPYTGGPVLLGADPVVQQVDPMWRGSPAPYGPVMLVLLRAVAVSTGGLTGGVLLLRVLALLGVAAAVAAALALARPRSRGLVLALTVANPVTLVHLVGGVHVDALLAAAVGLSVLALHSRRFWLALALAGLATAVKVTALPLAVLVLVVIARDVGVRRSLPARATGLLVLPFALTLPVIHAPWGFLGALVVPAANSPWYAPATVVGQVLRLLALALGLSPDPVVTATAGRLLVLAAGGLWVLHELRTTWRDRSQERLRADVRRAGLILVVVALSLPAVYGWYLAAGLFTLAATGTARDRRLLVVASSALAFSSMPPLYGARVWYLVGAWAVVVAVLLLAARSTARARVARAEVPVGIESPQPVTRERSPDHVHRLTVRMVRLAGISLVPALGVGLAANSAVAAPGQVRQAQTVAAVARTVTATYPEFHLVRIVPAAGPDGFTVDLVSPSQTLCQLQLTLVPETGTALRLPSSPVKPETPSAGVWSCPQRPFVTQPVPESPRLAPRPTPIPGPVTPGTRLQWRHMAIVGMD